MGPIARTAAVLALVVGQASAQGLRTIAGTVVVGGSVPRSGWVELLVDSMAGTHRVRVVDGRWHIDVADWHEIVCVGRMQLGGREAYCPETFPRIQDGYVIMARWTPVVTLRAVDAESGEDVPAIELVPGDWPLVPAVSPSTVRGAAPPVELPFRGGWDGDMSVIECGSGAGRVWWACAEGYAWSRIAIDATVGGERQVELHPGGDVRVQLLGEERRWTAVLYVIPAGATRHGAWPIWKPERPVTIDGLPPGEYTLEARGAKLLGRATVTVRAGETAHVELKVAP